MSTHLAMVGARTTFAPRLDLAGGRIVGFTATPPERWPGLRSSDESAEPYGDQVQRAVATVLTAARAAGTSPVTVHLPVPADVVAHAPHRLRAVRPAMLHGDGRSAGVGLLLGARTRSASTGALADGIAEARRDGFSITLPACGFAPAEIVRLAPDELVLDGACLAGVRTGDPAALATLEAAATLARATDLVLVADGVREEAELRDLRARGIAVASGPVLAAEQHSALPAEVVLAPGLSSRLRDTAPTPVEVPDPPSGREITLADVARPATVLADSVTGDEVRTALAEDPECAGVVLVDGSGRATGYVDRNRFLLTIASPYGRAVFAHRAAERLAEAPRVRPTTTSARDAVRDQLDGDPARRYDDTVLAEPDGRTVRIARFSDLVRALDPAAPPPAPAAPSAAPTEGARRGRHRLVGLRPRATASAH
ncbi:hypothetical protein WCD74_02480 [Actinomycetospora sp. OC33-EN08]|uniref:EAL domain-containing protein n=1 Tax=Actinomycetospora aurantiaca TaxID=3129233 RepID=A0ABU8MH47_9PSEU